jgi:tight adherence protein B
MTALVLASIAVAATYLLYSALVDGRRDGTLPASPGTPRRSIGSALDDWLAQAGLEEVDRREFVAVLATLAAIGAVIGWSLFGGPLPALALALFAASFPVAGYRLRRAKRRASALDAWPRLIEEIRVLTGSLGRSIPQALFDVGLRGPEELRPAFAAAHREWMISTDFGRTITVLKQRLGDATADMVCETLLVAHEVGGAEIDRRLEALAEDRTQDSQGRKDAESRQAGARFARRFVLFVPLGMALAGMSVGNGRAAYRTFTGQVFVLIGIGIVAICWIWAGRVMRLPDEERVLAS